ncbi:hypothetical protein GCM10017673_49230 [Streptosporangium violaceochromogenes]|nr:hypothetical protein GCM10017673_49230 [Streptosporangium violaceochromogenes]
MRVILAVAAAGVALTACSSAQAGAAAVVGDARISSGELDRNVREYESALAKVNVSASQLQFPGSVPQVVLFQLASARQYTLVAESKGIRVTDAEIDQMIAAAGGVDRYEQQMLQQAVPPSQVRAHTKATLLLTKLMAKYGGGTDEAAVKRGQVQAIKDLNAVPITWNPRYGTLNTQRSEQRPGLFADAGRFGAVSAAGEGR